MLAPAVPAQVETAQNALHLYPSIGEPGAEKIPLFTKSYPVLGR
jgi:hypothetical protein